MFRGPWFIAPQHFPGSLGLIGIYFVVGAAVVRLVGGGLLEEEASKGLVVFG
jgi:hypothetical protein